MFSDFFNTANPEANLYQDMIKETVDMYGLPVKYLPQHLVDTNFQNILGEDTETYFDKAIDMKMYLESYQEFSGAGDIFSKFGLTPDDRLTLIIDETTFTNTLQTALNDTTKQPEPGDLLYIPLLKYLSEVIYVNRKKLDFFTFTNIPVLVFVTKRLDYSQQPIKTGITELDDLANKPQPFEDNENITDQATEIRDFSKDNPFINIDNE